MIKINFRLETKIDIIKNTIGTLQFGEEPMPNIDLIENLYYGDKKKIRPEYLNEELDFANTIYQRLFY